MNGYLKFLLVIIVAWILFTIYVLLVLPKVSLIDYKDIKSNNFSYSVYDTLVDDNLISNINHLDSSICNKKCLAAIDSLEDRVAERKYINKRNEIYDRIRLGYFATGSIDNTVFKKGQGYVNTQSTYYFLISPLSLHTFDEHRYDGKEASVFIKDGKRMLKYLIKDTAYAFVFKGHTAYKPIDVAYRYSNKSLGIPISYNTYRFLIILFTLFFVVLIFWFLYLQIFLPIKCLYHIAKGNPFKESNIRDMYLIASFPVLLFTMQLLVVWLVAFINKQIIPDNFYLDIGYIFDTSKYYLLASVVVYMIARAFKRGYDLQKEQELTI